MIDSTPLPHDRRGFVHKRLLGAAGGFITGAGEAEQHPHPSLCLALTRPSTRPDRHGPKRDIGNTDTLRF